MKRSDSIAVVQLQKMPNGGSDLVLKKNVTTIQNALQKILSLRPVTWHWKTDTQNKTLNYGFIAQEVERILPNLVNADTWIDGTTKKHLSTTDMMPYIVRAIKEQQEQIEQLRHTVKQLEERCNKD